MPPGFEDDFAKGEQEAARLVARMRASLSRAEQFEASAKKNEQLKRRLGREAAEEARAGKTDQPKRTPEQTVRDRLKSEQRLNKAIEERVALERRSRAATEANAAAQRRALTAGAPGAVATGPGASIVATGGAGGAQPPRKPPVFFYQPGEYPDDPRRRRIGPGGPFGEIPQRTGPPYPNQRQLPAAGQTGMGNTAAYYEKEAKAKRASANAGRTYATTAKAEATSARTLGDSIGRTTGFQRSANMEFSRFGALSTEWIGAAGRGATTIQELGRQTTATIGKFGGWLGAGALLFVALDAVRAIGTGAIESASGVNQLERVITNVRGGAAQSAFRELSQEFNLPIGDVADAAYQMGKIFHDQDAALEASRAVLYSVKVGELDVATASRYLIATINGFHLPASQMTTIFDQVNAAQNKFGITIADVEAGIAKASGSFNAASTKGSPLERYHNLLALITTAQKATGNTGEVIGTAIARAPNFLKQASNKEILKKYGIGKTDDINTTILEAFEKARSLPGKDIADIGSAIFGPQYGARVLTPTLQQYDKYKEVLAGTSKEASKNSGQRELNTLLGTYSERLKAVGTELESIGSGLNQAGFLAVFGLGLEALTGILNVSNEVLEVFNQLPGPLKVALATMIEMRLVVGALRKFNVGDNFAPGSAGRRIFSGPNREARLYKEQLVGSEESIRRNLETTNNQLGSAERRVIVSQSTLSAERQQLAVMEKQGVTGKKLTQQQINVTRAEQALEAQTVRQLTLAEERRLLLSELNSVETANTALKQNFTNTEARNLASRRGEAIPGSFNRGRMSATELGRQLDMRPGPDGTFYPIGAAETGREQVARAAKEQAAERAARAAEPRATFRQAGRAWKALGQQEASLGRPIQSLTAARAQFASAALTTATAARAAIPSIGGAKAGIAKAATGLRGLGRSMYDLAGGPLGALVAGAFLAFEYGDDLGKALAGGQDTIDRVDEMVNKPVRKTGRKQNYIAEYEEYLRGIGTSFEELEKEGGPQGLLGYQHVGKAPKYFNLAEAARQKRLIEGQARLTKEGVAVNALGPDIIRRQLESLEELKGGTPHYRAAIQRLRSNLAGGDLSDKERKDLTKQLRAFEAKGINQALSVTDFFGRYNATADKLLDTYIANLNTLVEGGPAFATQKDLRRFTNASAVGGLRKLFSSQAGVRAKGAELLQSLPEALAGYGEDELKTSLALARTQGARERAYDRYISSLSGGLRQIRAAFGKSGKEVQGKLRKTEREMRQLEKNGDLGRVDPRHERWGGWYDNDLTEDQRELETLQDNARRLRRAGKEIGEQQRNAERQLRAMIAERRDAQTQERIGVFGELGELAAARVGPDDQVGQAQVTLRFAEKALAYARNRKATGETLRQAQLTVLNARQAFEEAVRAEAQELADANAALAQARAHGDPIKEAQAEIAAARTSLNLAQTAAERRNALAELITAEHQLEEDRANIALAGLQLEAAQTDNPVKQAAIKVREADLKLKQAQGKQAKLEARANRAAAVRERRDAVAQAQIENVEFQASLGRITAEQEIAAYQRILRTLKLSKETRRSLMERIHNLQEETSGALNLTVGNIQLPTLYDIRRAVQGGVNGGRERAAYADNSTSNIEININGGDIEKVGRTVEDTVRRSTRNSRRSAGHTRK